MTRVFVVAPTPTMRAGLRAVLASSTIEVVGEAAALNEPTPDVSDVDVILLANDELLRDVARHAMPEGDFAMVVLSDAMHAVATLRSLRLRGWGVIAAEATPAELQAAVLAAAQGMIVFALPLADQLLGQRGVIEAQEEPLTPREREVLGLLSQGLSNKLIARALKISEHTVKFHISSIYTKLGAASRTDAISRGARRGLIIL